MSVIVPAMAYFRSKVLKVAVVGNAGGLWHLRLGEMCVLCEPSKDEAETRAVSV